VPAALDAVTVQLTLRRFPALTASQGVAPGFVLPFTRHSYENPTALRQLPRLQVRVFPERVTLGPLMLRGSAVGLAARQIVDGEPSCTYSAPEVSPASSQAPVAVGDPGGVTIAEGSGIVNV
jgi:hypothetical protein